MDYRLKIKEETIPVQVSETEGDRLNFSINQTNYKVNYSVIDNYQLHLSVNGKRINAFVISERNGKTITINGRSFFIEDADSLELLKKNGNGAGIPDAVSPPMPSIVIAVLAAPGERVTKGQGVIVVSAMKMETTLFAPYNGKILSINTDEGEKVNPGDILVDIEKEETGED